MVVRTTKEIRMEKLLVLAIILSMFCVLAASTMSLAASAPTNLTLGDGSQWSFPRGPWVEKGGVINPPDVRNLHSRAFYKGATFTDFTAEFDYNANYRELGHGDAGLMFRAQDNNHFYYVHFPWGGQQLRAKHFWAAISKVDGDGYIRNLGMEWVPGIPSETDRWYHVKVEVKGKTFTVWIDGRPGLTVTDDTYRRGAVGLAGYGWYFFKNVSIDGKAGRAPKWDDAMKVPEHNFEIPGLTSGAMPTTCIAPNGDVLLGAGKMLIRSTDKGKTWQKPEEVPEKLGTLGDYGNTMFRTVDGRLMVMIYKSQATVNKPEPEIYMSESTDNGKTWSDPVQSAVATGWPIIPKSLAVYGPVTQLEDGTILRYMYYTIAPEGVNPFPNVITWGTIHSKAYCIRSADAGKSWSAPVDLDWPTWNGQVRGAAPGSLDLTEPTGVAMGKDITVVIRPVYSPNMWQCWSHDGGVTWDSAARTTFPGYAQSMVRTQSGAIVVAHRYPNYSINVSRDNGLSWDQGTIIDYPAWAMGFLLEVEPNVLLCSYMNWDQAQPLLLQRIRVKTDRIEPLYTKSK